jgi:hypothetical protein
MQRCMLYNLLTPGNVQPEEHAFKILVMQLLYIGKRLLDNGYFYDPIINFQINIKKFKIEKSLIYKFFYL